MPTVANTIFRGWPGLLRVLVAGTLAYAAVVLLLRVSGKRTLSKMNALGPFVTVAPGSTLATVLRSGDVALAEGVLVPALLIGLQFLVAWLSVGSERYSAWVKAEPRRLFYRGAFLRAAMRHERVTEDEVLAAVREHGAAGLAEVGSVVLETAGSPSVTRRSTAADGPPPD